MENGPDARKPAPAAVVDRLRKMNACATDLVLYTANAVQAASDGHPPWSGRIPRDVDAEVRELNRLP